MKFRAALNTVLTFYLCWISVIASAQTTSDALLDRLADPDLPNWEMVEREVLQLWSSSGSPTADYLLQQGRIAMQNEQYLVALDHFTALTDHAPGFAEGWHARAALLFELQRFGPALADLQRVLSLEPRHFGALVGLGIILEDIGEERQALTAYEAAFDIHPNQMGLSELLLDLRNRMDGEAL